jgi:hypothetical protein
MSLLSRYDEDSFTIVEYIPLGLNDKTSYYPLEKKKQSISMKMVTK